MADEEEPNDRELPVMPAMRRMTPRMLFEIALTSLSNQYLRVRGRIGTDEAQELRQSIERLRVYHEVTWPADPEDKPLT